MRKSEIFTKILKIFVKNVQIVEIFNLVHLKNANFEMVLYARSCNVRSFRMHCILSHNNNKISIDVTQLLVNLK